MEDPGNKVLMSGIALGAIVIGLVIIFFISGLFSWYSLFTTPLPAQNTLLTKVNPAGVWEWQTTFPGLASPVQMHQAPDGGYILYGGAYLPGKVIPYWRVLKIQPGGKTEWEVVKPSNAYYPEILYLDAPVALTPANNGYTVIDGLGTVIRLDENGKELWHRQYYGDVDTAAAAPGDGSVLAGTFHYRKTPDTMQATDIGWILMLDASGNRIWENQAHEYRECGDLSVSADGTIRARCARYRSADNSTEVREDQILLNSRGEITGRDPPGPESRSGTASESYVPFTSTALPGGKIRISSILHPNASVKEMVISDTTGPANLTEAYRMIPTGDRGFLVFSTVMI